ncbi:alpha/beta hydrolase family protein [Chryseobacterium sp. 'Rf worker isolate 10']|uniref:alpha/beta hydrolase family protein n=1 Tax=Chryseobacterium sp. 'Rf worker isolate 10' TaxID=2887348 RepID=UPI003D6EC3CB
MRKLICIYLLLLVSSSFSAQATKDTLESWVSKFYRLGNPVLSEDGKWAAVRKKYDVRQDTVLVVGTRKPNTIAATIVLDGSVRFLKNDGLLVYGNRQAEFVDLKLGKNWHYDNVVTAFPLSELGQYGILTKDSILSIYTKDGIILHQMKRVQGLPISDEHRNLYVVSKNKNTCEVMAISGGGLKKLSTISHIITNMELLPSGKHLIVSGPKLGSAKLGLTFVNTASGKSSTLSTIPASIDDYFKVTEIKGGKAYWIGLFSLEKPENGMVNIWYGNDDNLAAKKKGVRKGRYWMWKLGPDQFQEFPTGVYPAMASLNSERYFLAYHPTKGHDFVTLEPQFIDTSIYDAEQKTYRPLASLRGVVYGSPELICANDGRLFVGSVDGKKWTVFNLEDGSENDIDKVGLQNPVFSNDNRCIFFESEDDLWKYDAVSKTLLSTKIAPGRAVRIVNGSENVLLPYSHINVTRLTPNRPILLEVKDRAKNETSYCLLNGNTVKKVIPSTRNKLGNIVYDSKLEIFCALEESYNRSPQLYLQKNGGRKELLLSGGIADPDASLLRQEVIHYRTSEGLPLKGVLYYPEQYNPKKKYPMVVHIYQIQSDKSNEYLTPGYNNADGFDIRTLVTMGYFVLLPDTVVGPQGAGVSALDCVNKALDMVYSNPSIDMSRIGLIGHSFGGYETDFIATQSKRFATYISGSGESDIIRDYFSYHYHFPGPHYWQYENGQFDMKISFLENKTLYFKNNPIYSVDKVNAPILLWTGSQDQHVPWDQTMEFYIGLKRYKKPVIALFYAKGGHTFGFNSDEKRDLYVRVLDWWNYFLKDQKNIPWIDKQMKRGAL